MLFPIKSRVLYASQFTKVEYFWHPNSQIKNIAFVFSPSLNRELEGNKFGGNTFFQNQCDVISFKQVSDLWFQDIPEQLFSEILKLISEKGYIKKIAYGSSMGGFASIAFSKMLKCNLAIAISPQYSIGESFDERWKSYSKEIFLNIKLQKIQ